jgi:hypothetical protein
MGEDTIGPAMSPEETEALRRAAEWAKMPDDKLFGMAATLHSTIKERELTLIEFQRRLIVAIRTASDSAGRQADASKTLNGVMVALTVATAFLALVQVAVAILTS